MGKKSHGWTSLLLNLLTTIPSIFNVVSHFIASIEYELCQAKRSLILLFVLALFAITFMLSGWLCVCAMLFLWLQSYFGAIPALAVLLSVHFVLLLIVGMWMALVKNGLFFSNTRKLLQRN